MKKALLNFILVYLLVVNFKSAFAQPSNDVCASATTLTSSTSCSYTSGTTTGATQSVTTSCNNSIGDDDVWYKFVAQSATHIVQVQGATGFDPVIDVRSGACTGTNIGCIDVTALGGLETASLTNLVVGTTYLIRIYHFGTGAGTGNFQICVTHTAPQAPVNDVCTSAISLTSSSSCNYTSGSTSNATQSITFNCGNSNGDDDVWYKFVAQAATHVVKVQSGAGFDAVIDVRSGACTGTSIGCIDANATAGLETANLTSLVVGDTYLIRVYNYGTGSGTGSFQICVTHTPPSAPANDACTSAISLTSGTTCSYTSGTTTGATQSITGTCGGSDDDDVWYKFVAVATTHSVQVQGSSGFDAVIDVRSGSCTGTSIGCTDSNPTGSLETANLTNLVIGNTYLVRVYHFIAGAGTGNFQICVTHTGTSSPPANDVCTSAISLTSSNSCNYTSGSTTNATQSVTFNCGNSNGDDDVWYKFVAQAATQVVKVQSGAGFDAVIDVRSGSCTGTSIGCIDANATAGLETANLTNLVVGDTYYIRIYHFGAGSGTGNFQVCVTHTGTSAPANDACANAISLTSSTSCSYTSGTTTGATQSITTNCGNSNGDDDVWYTFVAQSTSHTIKVQGVTGFDAVIDIRNGSCSGTNFSCTDATTSGGLETANLTNLTIGATYLFRVYNYGTGAGTGSFQVCVTHTGSSTPPNDLCANATSLTSSNSCNYISGTTTGATQSITTNCGNSNGDDDVWYTFVAQSTNHTIKVQSGTGFDAVIDIRNGSCSGTNFSCTDANASGGLETANLTNLTIGATYLFRVYNYGTGAGTGNFQVCVTHTPPPVPANDLCANATSLTSSNSCTYTTGYTTGATQSITTNCGNSNGDDDVWYTFVAQSTTHVIQVQSGAGFDAVIDIRNGGCSGTNFSCTDANASGGLETANLTNLTIGATYLFRVYNYGTGSGSGNFQICVTHTGGSSTPPNDQCANAITLNSSTTCTPTAGSTLGATQSLTTACGAGNGDDDVWYRFTAVATTHTVTVTGSGGFDAVIELRNAPACSGSNISCTDVNPANGTEVATLNNLVVGTTYALRIYHYGVGNGGGSFNICITHTGGGGGSAPANDVCSSAQSLTSSTSCNYTQGTTTGATQSIAGTCLGNGDDDVWYSFVAVATSHVVKVQGATGFDAVIDVRSSSSCTGTNIQCTDASGVGGLETSTLTGLTIGTTYLIRVYHFTAGAGGGNFDICVTHTGSSAPTNDACAAATSITSSTSCNYTSGTTTGATQSIAGTCNGTPDDDVWYSFVAVATNHTVTVQGAAGFDATLDIRTGACMGTNLMCKDVNGAGGTEVANLSGLTIGATYLVRVFHFAAGAGTGNFQICVTHTGTQAPANDLCTAATALTSSTSCSYTNGTTSGATQTIAGTCNGTGDDDVWYSFVAVSTSHVVQVQSGTGFDAVVDVRNTPNCSGTNILCTDGSGLAGLETATLTNLTVGNTYMVRVYHYGAGAGSGDFQICVTHTTQSCTYTISPSSLSYASTGGTGTITVTPSGTNCNWTATTSDSWITITSGSAGTGNGSVTYTVAPNNGTTQLTGTIVINGQTHTVAQNGNNGCTFTISPLNQSFSDQAGTGTVTVTTTAGCNWAATANDSWITVTSGGTGSGNGTVTYSVTANTGTAQRVGTITIAGQIHSITQSGVSQCAYTIAPTSLNYNSAGGSGTVNVTAGSNCTWTATTTDSWITITSGSTGSGNAPVSYTVANNTGTTQRTGTITAAGQTHTVIQDGLQCTYTIAPTALSFGAGTDNGTVNVTAAAGCPWTASTTDSWITITSGTGTGSGTVTYSISANTGTAQRLGTITIGGQTHTVVQNGTSSCTYTLTPTSQTFTAIAGSGNITVASSSGCNWTAISNDSWIFISSGNTGTGNGTVTYTVTASTSTTQRTGTITVGGQIFTVTQSGIVCPPTPIMQSVGCSLAANGISNVTYQWYLSSTPIIGATSQFYTANQPGFYSVYVTDITNGCVTSSQPAYVACSGVGVDELSLEDAIVIYPNPTAGDFSIKSTGVFIDEQVKVSIINTLGQTIYSSFATVQNGEINLTINGLNPQKGTYTVLFTSEKTHATKRVTVN